MGILHALFTHLLCVDFMQFIVEEGAPESSYSISSFSKTFLLINQKFSVNRRIISKIHNLLFPIQNEQKHGLSSVSKALYLAYNSKLDTAEYGL